MELLKKVRDFTDKKSDTILTVCTCTGVVITMIMAFKAGPKVKKVLETHKNDMKSIKDNKEKMGPKEFKDTKRDICAHTVKDMAISAGPAVAMAGVTCACAVGAHKASARKIVALSTAFEITKEALTDYKDAVKEVVPKKAEDIKEAVIKKRVQEEPIYDEQHTYSTGRGDILCKDTYTHVQFRSSMEEIGQAINRLSARVGVEQWVTLQELYYELNVKSKDIPPCANDIGWHDSDLIEGNLPIIVKATLDSTDTIPVLGLYYEVDPYFKEGGRFRR